MICGARPKSNLDTLKVRALQTINTRRAVKVRMELTSFGNLRYTSVPVATVILAYEKNIHFRDSPHPSNETNSKEPPKYLQEVRVLIKCGGIVCLRRKYVAHRQSDTDPWMYGKLNFVLWALRPLGSIVLVVVLFPL